MLRLLVKPTLGESVRSAETTGIAAKGGKTVSVWLTLLNGQESVQKKRGREMGASQHTHASLSLSTRGSRRRPHAWTSAFCNLLMHTCLQKLSRELPELHHGPLVLKRPAS